jgi:RHS repeat-associated protein
VTSGKKRWLDTTPVAGQQFEYMFDDIGNRISTKAGGGTGGAGLRSADYTPNRLNQYEERDVPGALDVTGVAPQEKAVTVNGQMAERKWSYFHKEIAVNNDALAVWQQVEVDVSPQGSVDQTGHIFVPRTPEVFGYDGDGNLTSDGRWTYIWDAENRLVRLTARTSVGPQQRIEFAYDWKGRRIGKKVWDNVAGTGNPTSDLRFVYDGWNLVAVLNSSSSLLQSFTWGLDLSGTPQGAGGVGGLLMVKDQSTHFVACDGNGNVAALVNAADGQVSANYEYGPFGELLRATGPVAKANPFRFSTKYQDDETDQLYYGYRFYNPSTGRWPNRDPIEEWGGFNLYGFVGNDPVAFFDDLGLACSWAVGRCTRNVGQVQVPQTVTVLGKTYRIPNWIRNTVSRAVPDHHDVRVESYSGANCKGSVEETITRGFFANSFSDSITHYAVSLIPLSGVDGYVPGSVQDSASTAGQCSLSCVPKQRFDTVKQRITTSTASRYHLTGYNCQTWASQQLQ